MLMAVVYHVVGSTAKHARQMPARLVARASAQQQGETRKGPLDHLRDAAAVSKRVAANTACMFACSMSVAAAVQNRLRKAKLMSKTTSVDSACMPVPYLFVAAEQPTGCGQ